jgi:hypothetical protein
VKKNGDIIKIENKAEINFLWPETKRWDGKM